MRYLVKTLTVFGTIAAAGAAHAATEVVTNPFDFSWSQSASAPFTNSFTLVPDNAVDPSTPDFQAFFDTGFGTLNSVTVQWSNLKLSMQGYGGAPSALGGAAIAQTQVNGYDTGVLGVIGGLVGLHPGWLSFTKAGNSVSATFDAGNDPNGIFTDAANGQTLDIKWNTGTIATLSASSLSSLPTSGSGLVVYGIQSLASQSPSAKLSGDMVVTFDYSPTAVPEPSTWAMMMSGFAGLGFAGWRARKAVAVAA